MKIFIKTIKSLTAFQLLVGGYALVTLVGAIFLSLPISTANHQHQPFADALFVATSGISTTGLNVVDTGSYYSFFGQLVLLCIFQIGGIGYMSIIICIISMLGWNSSLLSKNIAVESLSGTNYRQMNRFLGSVVAFTAIIEIIGAIVLALILKNDFPLPQAIYSGIFHSISAFCTAGFSIYSDSMTKYDCNTAANLTIDILSLLGGIGFIVIYEFLIIVKKKLGKRHSYPFSVHTKFAVIITVIIITIGTIIIYFSENWDKNATVYDKILKSSFQSISASTTDGFNTVDISKMSQGSLTYIMFLMFTGASPGSTAGGIKTTTFGLIIIFMIYYFRGREDNIHIFKHQIPAKSAKKAVVIFIGFIIIIFADFIIMTYTEKASFIELLFEITSALANTGLSMGITAGLSLTGKILLTITMFIGRVGPVTLGLVFAGRQSESAIMYSEEDILIG